jgi:hypothetical protein
MKWHFGPFKEKEVVVVLHTNDLTGKSENERGSKVTERTLDLEEDWASLVGRVDSSLGDVAADHERGVLGLALAE